MIQNYKNRRFERSLSRFDHARVLHTEPDLKTSPEFSYQDIDIEPWKSTAYPLTKQHNRLHKYQAKNERVHLKHNYGSTNSSSKRSDRLLSKKRNDCIGLPSIQKINIIMPIPTKSRVTSRCYLNMFTNQFIEKNGRSNIDIHQNLLTLDTRLKGARFRRNFSEISRETSSLKS